jgi:hypothetical protein
MNTAITFPENIAGTKMTGSLNKIPTVNPVKGFQKFIEKSDWDERLMGYEKYINMFICGIIGLSAVFFIPVCISIFTR